MGRKSKAELLGLIERITRLAKKGNTNKQIETILRAEGVDISREAIRRTVKTAAEAAKEYNMAYEEAKAITETIKNNPGTEVMEAINAVIATKFLAEIKNIDGIELKSVGDISKLVTAVATSQTKLAAERLKYNKGYETAKADFIAELNKELKDKHPDVLATILEIVKNMKAKEENG